jgi:hypothetical protein
VRTFLTALTVLFGSFSTTANAKTPPPKTCEYTPEQHAFMRGVHRAFDKLSLPRYVRFAFMANAMHESGMGLRQVSHASLPDSKSGGSHTAYQILRPNLVKTISRLKLRWSDVVPPTTLGTFDEIEQYAEVQTRTALALADTMGLKWSSTGSPELVAVNFFSRWAAGSWPWSRVLKQPNVAAILKGGIPRDNAAVLALARKLERNGRLIAASSLFKLVLFRRMQQPCFESG